MGGKKLLVGGIVVVALIVIAYFAFMYPPPSKEDTSGAIGVAKKYRSEQITDNDVILKEQEDAAAKAIAAMTPDEKAAFFEKTTPAQRFELVSRCEGVVNDVMGRVDPTFAAKFFNVATDQQRVDMYKGLSAARQMEVLGALKMTAERFEALDPAGKSKALMSKSVSNYWGNMFREAPMAVRVPVMARFDAEMQRSVLGTLGHVDAAQVMGYRPAVTAGDMQRQDAAFAAYQMASPQERWARLCKSEAILGDVLNRVEPDLAAKFFNIATDQQRVDIYNSLSAARQMEVLGAIQMTAERFNALNPNGKSEALLSQKLSNEWGNMFREAPMAVRIPVMARADAGMKRTFVDQLGRNEAATLWGYAPTSMKAEAERSGGININPEIGAPGDHPVRRIKK